MLSKTKTRDQKAARSFSALLTLALSFFLTVDWLPPLGYKIWLMTTPKTYSVRLQPHTEMNEPS